MRRYRSDSADAAARVLTLALLADGALDKSEIDCLDTSGLLERLRIPQASFDRVVQEFCEDVACNVAYLDAVHCRLSAETIDSLLDEITAPPARRALFEAMRAIAAADGTLGEGEKRVLSRAAARWGLSDGAVPLVH